jgi:hypothetical protein
LHKTKVAAAQALSLYKCQAQIVQAQIAVKGTLQVQKMDGGRE